MPIRPIDLQTIATLTKEVERIQSSLQQRPTEQQQQFAAQFRHDVDAQQGQVNAAQQGENPEISKDKQGEGARHEAEERRRREGKKDENITYIDDDEGHNIDVKA